VGVIRAPDAVLDAICAACGGTTPLRHNGARSCGLLFIDGEWRQSVNRAAFAFDDPSTGRPIADAADAGPADAIRALDAACVAAPLWARKSPRERSDTLFRGFQALLSVHDELALIITMENGKPLDQARAEVLYAAEYLRWYAEEAERIEGEFSCSPDGRTRTLVMHQPIGPALAVLPWNWPLVMAARDAAPALAAGCSIVLKPAEETPLSCLAFAAILQAVGVPPGVVNVVTTSQPAPVVDALIDDDRLRLLSFTGSVEVGMELVARTADHHPLHLSMELGGNAPFIVFADADLDRALNSAMLAKMRNGGASCTAANRFLVEERLAAEFAHELARRMEALVVGVGTEEGVEVGPMASARERDRVADLVDGAIAGGAQAITGGHRLAREGWFYPPTVLTSLEAEAPILSTEIFGPVAPVLSFTTEHEAVALANATPYGLVAYVHTRDVDRALRVIERIEAGMVGLNRGVVSNAAAPFGGVKFSGFGRKGGKEGIAEYLDTKYVAIDVEE